MNKIDRKILKLKKKARKIYLEYQYNFGEYGCGETLARHMSKSLSLLAEEFNKVMDELSKYDKTVTKGMRL